MNICKICENIKKKNRQSYLVCGKLVLHPNNNKCNQSTSGNHDHSLCTTERKLKTLNVDREKLINAKKCPSYI